MSDEIEGQSSGLSRRDALKRGAAIGGALWVAPLVTAAPAFGADPSLGDLPGPCVNPLWVKFDDAEYPVVDGEFVFPDGTPALGTWDDNYNQAQDTCITPPSGTDGNWAAGTLPSGVLVPGWSTTSVSETWTVTAKTEFGGKTYRFRATTTPSSITLQAFWVDGATLKPIQIIDALWSQASRCYPLDPASNVAWNSVTWALGDPGDISHISAIICG